MLVVCPKCFTQYVISDEIKVPEGQRFHCSACHHYFTLKSERQTGFYGEEGGLESEEIPTVSAVMNETETEQSFPPESVRQNQEVNESYLPKSTENESNREKKSDSPEKEPMALLANETPLASDRLGELPEAFKPVTTKKKKTSVIGTLFWLCVAGGICYGALQVLAKYPILEQTEDFILSKLDKNYIAKGSSQSNIPVPEKKQAESQPMLSSQNKENKPLYIPPMKLENPIISVEEAKTLSPENQQQTGQPTASLPVKEKAQMPPASVSPNTQSNRSAEPPSAQSTEKNLKQKPIEEPVKTPVETPVADTPKASVNVQSETPVNVQSNDTDSLIISEKAKNTVQLLDEQLEQSAEVEALEKEVSALAAQKQQSEPIKTAQTEKTPVVASEQPVQEPQKASEPVVSSQTEQVPLFSVESTEEPKSLNTKEIHRILKIQDVSYELSLNEAGVMRLMIKGLIANTELTKVVIPELKAIVYDQNDTPVARKRIILSQSEIEGNSVQSFFSSVVPAPEQVSHVEVVFDE